MRVVITGGAGFIGRSLTRRLLARGEVGGDTIDEIVAFDAGNAASTEAGVVSVSGDIADREVVAALVKGEDDVVFHLASMVSGAAEEDFDRAQQVNLQGTINVLEACRAKSGRVRLVFASTISTFGRPNVPESVADSTKQTPENTYGVTKAIGELLLNDYTRKGFLDGRAPRLPTVIIRPGPPNAALSGFASAIFREPLAGVDYALPVGLDMRIPVIGELTAVAGFIALAEVNGDDLGRDRVVNLPSVSVSPREMIDALHRVAGDRTLGKVELAYDAELDAKVAAWPHHSSFERALELSLPRDENIDSIARAYIEEHLG